MPAGPLREDSILEELMLSRRAEGISYERPASAPPVRSQPTYASYARPTPLYVPNPLAGVAPPRRPAVGERSAARQVVREYSSNPNDGTDFQDILDSTRIRTPASVFNPEQLLGLNTRTSQVQSPLVNESTANLSNTTQLKNTLYNAPGNVQRVSANVTQKFKEKYLSQDFVPGFISTALGLKNPLVEAGGLVPGGTQLNSDAINWLQVQSKLGGPLERPNAYAMGGKVNTRFNAAEDTPKLSISFEGLQGYQDPSQLKQEISKTKKLIDENLKQSGSLDPDSEGGRRNLGFVERNKERLKNLMYELNEIKIATEKNPLASEAIRYRLGDVLSAIPENTLITANPLGGPKGGRARLYRSMSEGALATTPVIRSRGVNLNLMPSEAEFRLASEGGGMTAEEFNTAIRNYGNIRTTKTGPEEFKTWSGKTVNWNPEQLKDPLIRAAFNVGEDVDVSSLRKNPTGVFLNKRSFDPTLPVITTRSPQYVTRQALSTTGKGLKTGTKGFLLDAGINYALGASPKESFATAISDPISAESLGGFPTAAIERVGPSGEFVDTRSNTVLNPQGAYTNTGVAYKGGKPIIVPRGSVAGEGNLITQTQNILQNAGNVWRQRLSKLGMFGR